MKYFDDMQSTYGFGDGDAAPAGVDAYREVYVRALNTLLAAHGSVVRVIAWDRPGMHNSCLILEVTEGYYATLDPDDVAQGRTAYPYDDTGRPPALDAAYGEALARAYDLDIDDAVEVSVTINTDTLHDLMSRARTTEGDHA